MSSPHLRINRARHGRSRTIHKTTRNLERERERERERGGEGENEKQNNDSDLKKKCSLVMETGRKSLDSTT